MLSNGGDKDLFKATWNPFRAAELPLANSGAVAVCRHSKRLFQQVSLGSEIYAALGTVDEEIYILRLRSITGSAKAFVLI